MCIYGTDDQVEHLAASAAGLPTAAPHFAADVHPILGAQGPLLFFFRGTPGPAAQRASWVGVRRRRRGKRLDGSALGGGHTRKKSRGND